MKKISILKYPFRKEETKKLQKILSDKGYKASLKQCEEIWIRYSEDCCSSWLDYLMPPSRYSDEKIFNEVRYLFVEDE